MSGGSMEVLCFRVGERVFAVDIMGIREILRSHVVTPVPTAPASVAGVINLRGDLVSVVDLHRALLRAEAGGALDDPKLVVVKVRGCTVALRVDQVLEVVCLSGAELNPVPGNGSNAGRAVVAAFRRELDGEGPVVVLLLRLALLLEETGIASLGGSE